MKCSRDHGYFIQTKTNPQEKDQKQFNPAM